MEISHLVLCFLKLENSLWGTFSVEFSVDISGAVNENYLKQSHEHVHFLKFTP